MGQEGNIRFFFPHAVCCMYHCARSTYHSTEYYSVVCYLFCTYNTSVIF